MSKAAHERWLRKIQREAERSRLKAARKAVADAKAARRSAKARARALCKRARAAFRRWVAGQRKRLAERIVQLRAQLRERIAARRVRLAQCCGRDEREKVKAASEAKIAGARLELEELKAARRRERIWSSSAPMAKTGGRGRAKERRGEADHEVEVNLSPDELIVWRAVKSRIHGTDHMSRTEAFQAWLHDHSADVAELLAVDAERAYERALKVEARERRDMKLAKTSPRALARYVTHAIDDVPF